MFYFFSTCFLDFQTSNANHRKEKDEIQLVQPYPTDKKKSCSYILRIMVEYFLQSCRGPGDMGPYMGQSIKRYSLFTAWIF
jgi:hypothetical protein